MDIHIPDFPIGPASPIPPGILATLLRMLAAAVPVAPADTPEVIAANGNLARAMFFAMQPQDAAAGAAAVRTIAAHFASMDLYARAARPGLSDDTVRSLRTSANACARARDTGQRRLRPTPQAAAESASPLPASPAQRPPSSLQQQSIPRDRVGKLIPLHRFDLMTKRHLDAGLPDTPDPELVRLALEEEEAMIAAQAAAKEPRTGCARGGTQMDDDGPDTA